MKVTSVLKLNLTRLKQLDSAAITALEKTAEALHTDLVQSQTMPFDKGNLQNESTFVDCSESSKGRVTIVSSTPYARRLYYHPEFQFSTDENPDAGGEWLHPYLPKGKKRDFAEKTFGTLYKREAGV